jgi:hypothetical protein
MDPTPTWEPIERMLKLMQDPRFKSERLIILPIRRFRNLFLDPEFSEPLRLREDPE